MREIVILSSQPEKDAFLISLVRTLFPECGIRILLQENTTVDTTKKGEPGYVECPLGASDS